jgi:subtilisin family serine protease
LQDAVNEAYTKGILIFAAAGNCACPDYEFPAACEHAISVGSINPDTGIPSAFNTRNDSNILFAPGENVLIPQKGSKDNANGSNGPNAFMKVSGTSFSAPFVAGLAALVLSKNRQTEPGFRMQRDSMISLLRDKDHLDLSCKVHNYSRESSCTSSLVTLEDQSEPLIQSHTFAILLAFTILTLAFVYAFFRH